MKNDHEALVESILEQVKTYVGVDRLRRVLVGLTAELNEVTLIISPQDSSLEGQLEIMDRLSEVEQMFADECVIEVRLENYYSQSFETQQTSAATPVAKFAYA